MMKNRGILLVDFSSWPMPKSTTKITPNESILRYRFVEVQVRPRIYINYDRATEGRSLNNKYNIRAGQLSLTISCYFY